MLRQSANSLISARVSRRSPIVAPWSRRSGNCCAGALDRRRGSVQRRRASSRAPPARMGSESQRDDRHRRPDAERGGCEGLVRKGEVDHRRDQRGRSGHASQKPAVARQPPGLRSRRADCEHESELGEGEGRERHRLCSVTAEGEPGERRRPGLRCRRPVRSRRGRATCGGRTGARRDAAASSLSARSQGPAPAPRRGGRR